MNHPAITRLRFTLAAMVVLAAAHCRAAESYSIEASANQIRFTAGPLQRTIDLSDGNVRTGSFTVGEEALVDAAGAEVILTIDRAEPNRQPRQLTAEAAKRIKPLKQYGPGVNWIDPKLFDPGVQWIEPIELGSDDWSTLMQPARHTVEQPDDGTRQLTITAEGKPGSPLAGVRVVLTYQITSGYPAIRKWARVENHSQRWLRIHSMWTDPVDFAPVAEHRTPLTPSERGAGSSVVAFGRKDGALGVIAVSEVPSALRDISSDGQMGYNRELFEWVLGPGESFTSEPTFHFAYAGEAVETPSAVSTPLDRTVEGPYMRYLENVVGVLAADVDILAPTWCTWSSYRFGVNDENVRRDATLAARCGFDMFLIDEGWQTDNIGTEPHPQKFPDFAATCAFVREQGLKLGLWVSCIRSARSPDRQEMPDAISLPRVDRYGGQGMAFASRWRDYYARDLARLHREYGAVFFKEDFTNVKYGDIAEGHESRTHRESLLRGLRALLEAQVILRRLAPDVLPQLTHEIYWGTPGVPGDVALLKDTYTYHMPPNDYSGNLRGNPTVEQLRAGQYLSCWNARRRFHEHRGLPAYAMEYYACHTVSQNGSLTPEIQDRQVCSWLAGAPSLFAGQLQTLTDEHIAHYRRRFELLAKLREKYDIYKHYQFSGVPAPTQTDYHWWGKLDKQGHGVVVVVRGIRVSDDNPRKINIPWVQPERSYRLRTLLNPRDLGRFTGKQLQQGTVELTLPAAGQEIIEVGAGG